MIVEHCLTRLMAPRLANVDQLFRNQILHHGRKHLKSVLVQLEGISQKDGRNRDQRRQTVQKNHIPFAIPSFELNFLKPICLSHPLTLIDKHGIFGQELSNSLISRSLRKTQHALGSVPVTTCSQSIQNLLVSLSHGPNIRHLSSQQLEHPTNFTITLDRTPPQTQRSTTFQRIHCHRLTARQQTIHIGQGRTGNQLLDIWRTFPLLLLLIKRSISTWLTLLVMLQSSNCFKLLFSLLKQSQNLTFRNNSLSLRHISVIIIVLQLKQQLFFFFFLFFLVNNFFFLILSDTCLLSLLLPLLN